MKKFSDWLAIRITNFVGSMFCAFLFCCLAFYGATAVDWHNPFQIVTWVSQTFLQLVLLSVIQMGTNLLGASTEKRAQEDHEMIKSEFQDVKILNEIQNNALAEMKELHEEMHEIMKEIHLLVKD